MNIAPVDNWDDEGPGAANDGGVPVFNPNQRPDTISYPEPEFVPDDETAPDIDDLSGGDPSKIAAYKPPTSLPELNDGKA